jgi:signal transduction histidine kinase
MSENVRSWALSARRQKKGSSSSRKELAMPFEGADRPRGGRRESDRILLRRDRELEAARRISQNIFRYTEVDELVEAALRVALEEVGTEAGSVLLADPEAKQLVFYFSIGEKPVPRGTAIPWDQGIAGAVFQSGEPVIIGDVKKSSQHYAGIDRATGFVTRDMITVPLKRWKGDPIGVLNVLNKRNGVLDEHDLDLLMIVSAFAALAIEQARLFGEAKKAEIVGLLGDIGHDLKNLLQPIVSGTSIMKSEFDEILSALPKSEAGRAKSSRDISEEATRMVKNTTRRIHDRVKEIADCVKGLSAPPNFSPCKVAEVVGTVIETLGFLAQERGIVLRTDGLDALPPIMADERRLYNAFYNLVNNAIPEVPAGGSITVRGRVEPPNGVVLLSVADTGRGMPPEIRDRLFSARAVSSKKGGTGLGTKIVKDVMDAHNGQITVESEVEKGTTFHIRLPIDQPGAAAR